MVTRRILFIFLAAVLSVVVLQGCQQEDVVRYDTNRPPETVLSVAPALGSAQFHKYPVSWTGYDRDGVVVAYRVASLPEDELYGGRTSPEDLVQYFLSLNWTVTDATESLFVFRADRPNSRAHSLYVAAIDNEGKVDPTPAATNFMAIDYNIPNIQILLSSNIDPVPHVPLARGDTLPAYNLINPVEPVRIRLSWGGSDPDGIITEWRYKLDSSTETRVPPEIAIRDLVYDPNDPGASDLGIGFHEFRLVAIDDAGAKSDESVAKFIINYDPDTHIDSVWTFRPSNLKSIPEKLIFPSDSIRVVYHFGRLRFKFHGTDKDGAPPDTFRWNIRGTLIQSVNPVDSKSPWVGEPAGMCKGDTACYEDETSATAANLDTDSPLVLFLRARDDHGKVDGSPDTIVFYVNYSPRITSISHQVLPTGAVRFTWGCIDPDEDITRGSDGDAALIQYRYRIDDGDWVQITTKAADKTYVKFVDVQGLAPGPHLFKLLAYNGAYILTRSDLREYDFSLLGFTDWGGGR